MEVLVWLFLPVLIGPVLIGAGCWCASRMMRALRQRPRAAGAAAAFGGAGLALLLVGLAFTAQALLLLLYAWMHNPPQYYETEVPAPVEQPAP